MTFGILFQEYYLGRKNSPSRAATAMRFSWVVTAMFVTMGLTGNLKSSLVKSRYEKRTVTLDEMIDKDMTIHMTSQTHSYLASSFTKSDINSRLVCQVEKKNSISPINRSNRIFNYNFIIN